MDFYQKIKSLRLKEKQSQKELAELLNVTPQAIPKWENNKSVPDILTLEAIRALYDVSLDSLIKGDKKLQEKLSTSFKIKHFFISFGASVAATISLVLIIGMIMPFLANKEFFFNYWIISGVFLILFFSILLTPFIKNKMAEKRFS